MKFCFYNLGILINVLISLFTNTKLATAQSIQTDGTTPTLPASCSGDCLIEGGLQQGNNLFHSFESFNVDDGATVLFQDPGVVNILSRVTGNELSEIFGTLGVSGGDANLFLINPNGIIFGQNSSLDVNGSFIATTADGIRFGEQGLLDTTANQIPLLTINPSALFFADQNQGVIRNESTAPAGKDLEDLDIFGLRVPDEKSLLLIGGNVIFDGGQASAFGGQLELGGLAEAGELEINFSDFDEGKINLNFPQQPQRADVTLTNGASVNVFFEEGGDIAINAEDITISGESLVLAGISGNAEIIDGKAGNITINATEKLQLINGSSIANGVYPLAQGDAGNIEINSNSLLISDRSFIETNTFAQGNAGKIDILVEQNLVIASDSLIRSSIGEKGVGNAGIVKIVATNISLSSGSVLGASVFGQGKGGNISLNITNSVNINGFGTNGSSGIYTTTEAEGIGQAGEITIDTNNFRVTDGGVVSSQTASEGNGGNISINANTFEAVNGGQVVSSAASSGNAGNINLQVADNLLLSGSDSNFAERLAEFGEKIVGNEEPGNSGLFANVRPEASGTGGNIDVTAGNLDILDGAEINVSAGSTGKTGSLNINAQEVNLDQGRLTAEAVSGNGGDITLNNLDLLQLSNQSTISTTAGTSQSGGDGGNININAPDGFIVANPYENSDITANAFIGSGGQVQINAAGIYGITERTKLTEFSDITASSERGVEGDVNINRLEIEPERGLIEIPTQPIPTEVAQVCTADLARNKSQFIVTGRGGFATSPREELNPDAVQVDWVTFDGKTSTDSSTLPEFPDPQPNSIVEATSWKVNDRGNVVLIANKSDNNPKSFWQSPSSCKI
ncbi:MAG: filamentous hemagglutinin N-terminal domain-containing protein [Waterburya sp.]